MDFVSLQRSTDSGRQAEASLEVGHGAKQNVKFLRGDEKTRFDFGEAPTISALNICRFCSGAVLGLSPICDQCGLCKLWFLMLEGLNRQFSRSIPAWWQVLAETYTICSVTRYTGEPYGRILQGSQENWLHGQSKKNTGVSCAAQDSNG
jgi:hypothetical protein